ncbi:MAG: carboxypeptidase-like regulatory domain-containing protein [Acidobacteriota bacterium]
MRKQFLLFSVLCVLCASRAYAQSSSSLRGVVFDPSGAVIPHATVILESTTSGARRETTSDSEGAYHFPQAQPGEYKLSVKAEGFAQVVLSGIRLLVSTPATVNVSLKILEAVEEIVNVSAEQSLVNTSDATIGNPFGTRPILQLPFEARNVVGLLSLQPGVVFLKDDPASYLFGDARNGAINGGKSDQANVTLDGVDVNDQQNRLAFTSVLRNTLDSIQEFRVTTTGANANQGRSSGAQVELVTKSGSNEVHGSLYYFHRNTVTSANDWFNNRSGVKRPKLLRNIFGGSVGGPIRKNRLFYFFNFEGRRDASESNVLRSVPSNDLRRGILKYVNTGGQVVALSPDFIRDSVDPLHIGPSPQVLQILQGYPAPNDLGAFDGLNTQGFRFTAPTPLRWNTYIGRLDWTADGAGKHTLFLRGNLQNDKVSDAPQFPGQQPNQVSLDNSKGLAVGYNALFGGNLVSTLRYGYTRLGRAQAGVQTTSIAWVQLGDLPIGSTTGLATILPVHTISEDVSWTRGEHSIQFGGVARVIRNSRLSTSRSFHFIGSNAFPLVNSGAELAAPISDLSQTWRRPYLDTMARLLGGLNDARANYNYNLKGEVIPVGSPVARTFGAEEYEVYLQDQWHLRHNLSLTAGLRWSLMPPVYETNGVQVSVLPELGDWGLRRGELAAAGRSQGEAGPIVYVDANGPNGRALYKFHKRNLAPRLALAYSPDAAGGWKGWLFGGRGQTSIRAGWGMYYDLFGMGVMSTLDQNALGLSTTIRNQMGVFTAATMPRFTGLTDLPAELIPPAPLGGPGESPHTFGFVNAVDHGIVPPYTMNMNLSIGRELGSGFSVEASYVGRLSRRSLAEQNIAASTNLRDPASGMTYFEAASQLALLINAGTPTAQVSRIPFWENLWSGAAANGLTATQVVYEKYKVFAPDYGTALADLDAYCSPVCGNLGPFSMFNDQFWGLWALSSIGSGNYHSMQWSLRKRFSQGIQFDFNYTWSKSLDLLSTPERAVTTIGGIVNVWNRRQNRAISDFDTTHQVNTNWVAELPFGRDRKFLSGGGRALDALVGGWQLSGLWRHTSGLPISVDNGAAWPTNWATAGWGTQVGPKVETRTTKNATLISGATGPSIFPNPATAFAAYRFTLPGESGQRNGLRADGFFTLDIGLAKRFKLPFEGHSLQFRVEAFNVTNSVRFNTSYRSAGAYAGGMLSLTAPGGFGQYTRTLVSPRVIQFGLRYEF